MKDRKSYETVSEAVNDLTKRGYVLDFAIASDKECLVCRDPEVYIDPDDFDIDEVHRFEGMTDPGDSMIVVAVSSTKHSVKGVLVSAYGMYADPNASRIMDRLNRGINGAY
jgi:hypothetical protein